LCVWYLEGWKLGIVVEGLNSLVYDGILLQCQEGIDGQNKVSRRVSVPLVMTVGFVFAPSMFYVISS